MVETVPSKNGWAWLVPCGMSIMFVVTTGPIGCFGLLFGEFLDDLGEGTQGITVISSVNFLCFSFTGLLTNYSLRNYSCRQVSLFGAMVFIAGNFLTIFVTSLLQMIVVFAIIPGIGMGLMVPAALTSFNSYFVQRRTFVMSIAQAFIGAAVMLYPFLVQHLLAYYGFRGAQAVITAITCNTLLAAITFRPNKSRKKPESQAKNSLLVLENTGAVMDKNHSTSKIDDSRERDKKEEETHELVPKPDHVTGDTETLDMHQLAVEDDSKLSNRKMLKTIVDLFDLTLLNDPIYVNITVGVSCAFFADVTFFILLPVILLNMGFGNASTALCMAMGAGGDLAGRLFLVIIGLCWPTVSSRQIMLVGSIMAVVCRTVFASVSSFVELSIATTILGFFRAWVMVPPPLVFAEYCGVRFPSAFGLYMVINGIIGIGVGPLVGWIRDFTGSYAICTHVLSLLSAICVLLWTVEAIILRCRQSDKRLARSI